MSSVRPQEKFVLKVLTLIEEREKAIRVRVTTPDGRKQDMWLPKSQVFEIRKLDRPELVISLWLAKQKGFV